MDSSQLVGLDIDKLRPTVTYLRQASAVLGSLQRAYIPKEAHLWHYGLEISLRGITTQAFTLEDRPMRASLDFVRHKLRFAGNSWSLREYPPGELFMEIKRWLADQGQTVKLEEPVFAAGLSEYDPDQAEAYAHALWWMERQFRQLSKEFRGGLSSPVLLYPHHFDLSLVWFPFSDDRQIAVGWSTGDETIPTPYLYLTAYPEPQKFTKQPLNKEAYWQSEGFSGAVLPYAALVSSADPAKLLRDFTLPKFTKQVFD